MSVDGALNLAGISLEGLAVAAGVIASPAGDRLRRRLAEVGGRIGRRDPYRVRTWGMILAALTTLWLAFLPFFINLGFVSWWMQLLIGIALGAAFVLALVLLSELGERAITQVPDTEREVAVFLGLAGAVFGIGLILQLIAAATP